MGSAILDFRLCNGHRTDVAVKVRDEVLQLNVFSFC